jgi:hypothetical protein
MKTGNSMIYLSYNGEEDSGIFVGAARVCKLDWLGLPACTINC